MTTTPSAVYDHWPPSTFGAAVLAKALAGLLTSGLLMALPGAILLVWRYHIDTNYLLIGGYFLAQSTGIVVSPLWVRHLLARHGVRCGLSTASFLAAAGLAMLLLGAPPHHFAWRVAGFLISGSAVGLMNISVYRTVSPAYRSQPASTLNLAGVFYGMGSLACALILSAAYFACPLPVLALVMVAFPFASGWVYLRVKLPASAPRAPLTWRDAARDFHSPAAILFALFLFFAFGNEGALAGWLALFLTQKLGLSPARSLWLLGLYWLALALGRIAVQALLARIRHARILVGSVAGAVFGCLILAFTDNLFGAITGVLLCGFSFAATLPLAIERIGSRFPYYHPGFSNGIFSIAMTGGLLAPATIGLYASLWGLGIIMAVPVAGSIMVLLLLGLILLEARFHDARQRAANV